MYIIILTNYEIIGASEGRKQSVLYATPTKIDYQTSRERDKTIKKCFTQKWRKTLKGFKKKSV